MAASFWEQSINVFGGALAEPDPMPAGVAAATVTGTIGLALLLKVLAIAAKRQPIPGLAGAARRHLADLEGVPDADAAAYRAYLATPSSERKPFALEAIRVPLAAARTCADGVELCGQADKQITGLIEADLQAAAAILHARLRECEPGSHGGGRRRSAGLSGGVAPCGR